MRHTATHCNTLQYAVTRCNTLHHTATRCNTAICNEERYMLQHEIVRQTDILKSWLSMGFTTYNKSNTLQHPATHCNTLQHTATHCNTLQHTARHRDTPQDTATHRNTQLHTATRCNTLQHAATHPHTMRGGIRCNTSSCNTSSRDRYSQKRSYTYVHILAYIYGFIRSMIVHMYQSFSSLCLVYTNV